ncbi:MAG TPA: hypothetical protein DCG39_12530 [Opitutae bacterium]|nr:hypothetical protein [Opitutae bacterium]
MLMGFFFLGIVFFAFKKGEVSLGVETIIDFKRKDNPIGFCLTVIFYIFFGVMSFYLSFKL